MHLLRRHGFGEEISDSLTPFLRDIPSAKLMADGEQQDAPFIRPFRLRQEFVVA